MKRVEFYLLEVRNGEPGSYKVGEIRWDEKQFSVTNEELADIPKEPLRVLSRDGMSEKYIDPHKQPERFMRNLCFAFNSPYFCAMRLQDEE
jgi:hypothetical protein